MLRRVLILSSLAVAIAAVIGLVWFLRPQPRIDEETFRKIEFGMSEADVIALIGAPPGNYAYGDATIIDLGRRPLDDSRPKIWLGQADGIELSFDADGKVIYRRHLDVIRTDPSHVDVLLQMLHLKERNVTHISTGRIF